MVSEIASRKPGWIEGETVTLGDGQTWHVPRPVVTFEIEVADDGTVDLRKSSDLGFGPDYLAKYNAFMDAKVGAESVRSGAALVVALLRRNYDLDGPALARLLPYRPADPENVGMWQMLIDVAIGNALPKDEPPDDI